MAKWVEVELTRRVRVAVDVLDDEFAVKVCEELLPLGDMIEFWDEKCVENTPEGMGVDADETFKATVLGDVPPGRRIDIDTKRIEAWKKYREREAREEKRK